MKEAAGEANLTVVAIILIAVIVAVVTPLVRSLMMTAAKKSCCNDAGGVWQSGGCEAAAGDRRFVKAPYYNCVEQATGKRPAK